MSDTPRTDVEILRVPSCFDNIDHHVVLADFARQLETELTHAKEEANNWKQATEAHLKDKDELRAELKTATQLLIRCRNSAGRMGIELYEDLQNFLHTQPNYRS
jgi:hypothetical protein